MKNTLRLLFLMSLAPLVWVGATSPVCAEPSRFCEHDGTDAAPAVTLTQWQQIYHALQIAATGAQFGPHVVDLDRQGKELSRDGVIPIAALDIADGRFECERIFLATALKDYTHQGNRVTFVLPREYYFSTGRDLPAQVSLDCDDGLGYRPVQWEESMPVTYTNTGTKIIRLRVQNTEGLTIEGRFVFEVEHLQTPAPNETWVLEAEIPYEDGLGSGLAYIYLADTHTTLTDPVVVFEGFDLNNSMDWEELYYLLNREDLLETLRSDGFDFVVLNFDDSTDYIQKHAFLAVALIQQVQQVIPSENDIFVAGASMGGIVGRYALSYMEQSGLNHRARTFLAFDSPHQGASIPLGLQHWVDFFAVESAEAAMLRDILNRPSARQQLIYHFEASPPNSAASDPLRGVLLDELATLGDYPQNPRTVSIASGSGDQLDQGYPAGDQIIFYEYYSFLVDLIGNVWSVPNGAGQVIFEGVIDRIWPLEDDLRTVFIEGTKPYDTAPGGYRPTMVQLDTTAAPFGDIIALHDNHCFIPTISSLDLDTDDLFYAVSDDPDILALTPFDAVYFPHENQEHNIITPENKVWFMDEVRGITTGVDDAPVDIAGILTLLSNHPNPFNPATTISFHLTETTRATLRIYDLAGRQTRLLLDDILLSGGQHERVWDGRDARGHEVPSGIYFYRLEAGVQSMTKRMALIK